MTQEAGVTPAAPESTELSHHSLCVFGRACPCAHPCTHLHAHLRTLVHAYPCAPVHTRAHPCTPAHAPVHSHTISLSSRPPRLSVPLLLHRPGAPSAPGHTCWSLTPSCAVLLPRAILLGVLASTPSLVTGDTSPPCHHAGEEQGGGQAGSQTRGSFSAGPGSQGPSAVLSSREPRWLCGDGTHPDGDAQGRRGLRGHRGPLCRHAPGMDTQAPQQSQGQQDAPPPCPHRGPSGFCGGSNRPPVYHTLESACRAAEQA